MKDTQKKQARRGQSSHNQKGEKQINF